MLKTKMHSLKIIFLGLIIGFLSCVGGNKGNVTFEDSSSDVILNKLTEDGVDLSLSLGSTSATANAVATSEVKDLGTNGAYENNADISFTINQPGVASVSIHFSSFSTEKNYDFVKIYDKNGQQLASYHGVREPFWTPVFPGDSITVRFTSDGSITSDGFKIDEAKFEPGDTASASWNLVDKVIESPHPYSIYHDQSWTISRPGASQISVHFSKIDTEQYADFIYLYDKNGKMVDSYNGFHNDIWSKPIDGDTVTITLKADWSIEKNGFSVDKFKWGVASNIDPFNYSSYSVESAHPYNNNSSVKKTVKVTGANQIKIHFAQIDMETNYDFLIVQNANNVEIARYTGKLTNVWTPVMNGDTAYIILESDNSVVQNGYTVDNVGHMGGNSSPTTVTPIDFSTIVAVGDSLCHSFQSGAVEETRQSKSYCNLVSQQATGSKLVNPLLKYPGFIIQAEDAWKGTCDLFCLAKALIPKRVSKDNSSITNFSVTGADSFSVNYTTGNCEDYRRRARRWSWSRFEYVETCETDAGKYHKLTLNGSQTQVQQAVAKNPSFIIAFFTNNDSLSAALYTDPTKATDYGPYRANIDTAFDVLGATGAKGITASTPNITTISYLKNTTGSTVQTTGLKAFYNPTVSKAGEVLDASEVEYITNLLIRKNNYVRQKAAALGWAFVDLKAIFDNVKAFGHDIKRTDGSLSGQKAYASWPLPGQFGLFGLDGVHPNETGHCVMANTFIDAINSYYGQSLTYCDEEATLATDSLNQDPIDIPSFLDNTLVGKLISALIDTFI